MLIVAFEIVTLLLIALLVGTQILIPAIQGRLLFPFFRKTAELERELDTTHQEMYDIRLADEVNKARKAVEEAKEKKG